MKMTNKNKVILLSIIGSLIILLSISYAFFKPIIDKEKSTRVDVVAKTIDQFMFLAGPPIDLEINHLNFAEGMPNITGSTTTTAKLIANNKTNEAEQTYYVYFYIGKNEFDYSTPEMEPEIILTIKDPNGNTITNLPNLTYVTESDISGFDITNYEGTITVAENYSISTTSYTSGTNQDWTATITVRNLDINQNQLAGSELEGQFLLSSEEHEFVTPKMQILALNMGKEYIEQKPQPNFNNYGYYDEGMYAAEDDYGTSYYFRGAVDNNWVKFGKYNDEQDMYWRIVRINGDGSVKMMYSGLEPPTEEEKYRKIDLDIHDLINLSMLSLINESCNINISMEDADNLFEGIDVGLTPEQEACFFQEEIFEEPKDLYIIETCNITQEVLIEYRNQTLTDQSVINCINYADTISYYGLIDWTESRTTIGFSMFNNSLYNGGKPEYIGYSYTIGQNRGYAVDSVIKKRIDNWFEENMWIYQDYLSDFIMCNDRDFGIEDWALEAGTSWWESASLLRIDNGTPHLSCASKEDAYTVNDEINGNGQLTYPIGLITSDELMFTGHTIIRQHIELGFKYSDVIFKPHYLHSSLTKLQTDSSFVSLYLNSEHDYWTSSPSDISWGDILFRAYSGKVYISEMLGVRPVISLKNNVSLIGNGEWDNPYRLAE